jgi:hypothetical protein
MINAASDGPNAIYSGAIPAYQVNQLRTKVRAKKMIIWLRSIKVFM